MAKVKGKTSSGFDFAIDAEVFKDWRFLNALRKANSGDGEAQMEASFKIIELLFNNPEEEERFYAFLAEQNGGRAPVEAVGHEAGEIMRLVREKSKEAKN